MPLELPELPCPSCGRILLLRPNDIRPELGQIDCDACNLHAIGGTTEEAYLNLCKLVPTGETQCMFEFRKGDRCLAPAVWKQPTIAEDGSFQAMCFCQPHKELMVEETKAIGLPSDLLERILARWERI